MARPIPSPRLSDMTCFFRHVEVNPATGCWEWQGHRTSWGGYGQVSVRGDMYLAHRVAFTWFKRRLRNWETIDHLCRVRHCTRPEHLEPVTMQVNTLRGISPIAVNAAKTHCLRGHAFISENIYKTPRGRHCRSCQRSRYNTYNRKRRARSV